MRQAVVFLLVMAAFSADAFPRSRAVLREFQREHACPSSGAHRGACPGFEIDHIQALCAGGPDIIANLQWLSHEEHARKTKRDVAACRRRVYRP